MINQVAGLMPRLYFIVFVFPQNRLFIHVDGNKQHPVEIVFKDYESLTHVSSWKEFNFHVYSNLFSHRRKLFILQLEGIGHRQKKCHGQHHQGHHL